MQARRFVVGVAVLISLGVGALAQHSHTKRDNSQVMHTHHPTGDADGKAASLSGYVRDLACLLRNPDAGEATSAQTKDCMRKCVAGGSPVGILPEHGELYTPISDTIPDRSARAKLVPYVGKYVRVSGRVFERGGLHAISIESIEVIKRPADSHIP